MSRPVPDHGTYARYQRRCRCALCAEARREYARSYPHSAPAGETRRYIARLQESGLELRAIARLSGISERQIKSITHGEYKRVRMATEGAICGVPLGAVGANYRVPREASDRMLDLIGGVMTRGDVARAFQYRRPWLSFAAKRANYVNSITWQRLCLIARSLAARGLLPADEVEELANP
jgi:hypothetical protein